MPSNDWSMTVQWGVCVCFSSLRRISACALGGQRAGQLPYSLPDVAAFPHEGERDGVGR